MFKYLSNLKVLLHLHDFNNLCIAKRLAGHSKWANIKHAKAIADNKRGAKFTKLGISIKVAIAEGGSIDPKKNLQLQQIIEQARRVDMPLATIQSIIKSSQMDKTKAKTYTVEIVGPGGCLILCDVFTENYQLTKNSLQSILKKHGAKITDGGAKHSFEQKGIIFAEKLENVGDKELLEVATDHAIESGAEDVELFDDSTLQFICAATSIPKVENELQKMNYKIKSSDIIYLPLKLHPISETDVDVCSHMFEKLENQPHVLKLFDNIA